MKRKLGNKGKYQWTIYIWISIFFMVAQIVFSAVLLSQTKRQEVRSNYEMNEQIFRQAAYNIEQSNEVVRGICNSLFINPKIMKMLYSVLEDETIYDWSMDFQSVCNLVLLSNPQIHSIYIYNGTMDQLFSSYRYLGYQDEEIRALIDSGEKIPVLTPFVRDVENPSGKADRVMTYILYDSLNEEGKPDGAVIVNVDWSMFTDEIMQLLTFSAEEKSEIFIFDRDNKILELKEEAAEETENEIYNLLNEIQFSDERNFILQTRRINGEKYGIFFTDISGLDWIVVKIQSYAEVFSNVNRQIMMIVLISVIFCVLMLMSIYFLSRKIYSPIGKLVQKMGRNETREAPEINDIQYLNWVYEELFRKSKENKDKYASSKIMLNYNLQNLLIDGKKTDTAVWEALQAADPDLFQQDNDFGVGILQIDGYRKLQDEYGRREMQLYEFSIENIFTEILGNHGYHSVFIPVENGKMAVLWHGEPSGEEAYRNDIYESFRMTNEYLNRYFQISFSISVSAYRRGIEWIHEAYYQAEQKLSYRYALGKASFVSFDYEVTQADEKETTALRKSLGEHVDEGAAEKIQEDFTKLSELVKRQECSRVMEYIISQAVYILRLADRKEGSNRISQGGGGLERYTEILSLEDWEEMAGHLQTMLLNVLTPRNEQTQKTTLLVDTIQKIIREEYEDPNLCLVQIAGMVRMSSQYVGRIFRTVTGKSVAEYINEYRLEKSIEIMLKTKCTVNEVVGRVGIENESQYYRMFKKKYGDTPKAYMLGLMLEGKEEK